MGQPIENTQSQSYTDICSSQINEIDFASAYQALITSYLQLMSETQKRFQPLDKDLTHEKGTLPSNSVEIGGSP